MKIQCIKCNKIDNGFKGNAPAYILFGLAIPLVYLLGISMVSMVGLGLYVLLVHGSSKYICDDCLPKACPECGEKLQHKNHCRVCKIAICPFCGSHQSYKRPITLLSTAIGFISFIIVFIIIIGLFLINIMWGTLFLLVLLYFSSPACTSCGKRIHTEDF